METLAGKVAVITGAASGIGRALAQRCVQEKMKVVLADIEGAALAQTAEAFQAQGATVLPVRTDVSQAADIAALAERTVATFGAVHLLCNNAGVAADGPIWEMSLQDWEWLLGVNLWGVVHGIRTFVPLMLAQGGEAHIVNTASIAGLVSTAGLGVYNVTKHGVVTLSETLYQELQQIGASIHVSVLCPGWVNTRIHEAGRNRPPILRNQPTGQPATPAAGTIDQSIRQAIQEGIPAEEVADLVFAAIRERRFYILTHPHFQPLIQRRMENLLQGRNPR